MPRFASRCKPTSRKPGKGGTALGRKQYPDPISGGVFHNLIVKLLSLPKKRLGLPNWEAATAKYSRSSFCFRATALGRRSGHLGQDAFLIFTLASFDATVSGGVSIAMGWQQYSRMLGMSSTHPYIL
jgi:hypothetical protein